MSHQVANPVPGFYRRKLVKGGPWVPARIYLGAAERDQDGNLIEDERLLCEVNGEAREVFAEWTWLCGEPISEAEYHRLRLEIAGAMLFGDDTPAARPRQRIDLGKQRPVF